MSFDPVENVPHHFDTDMMDPTLHTVFANRSSTPGAETVAERVLSLVESTYGEEIHVLEIPGDMLKPTVTSLPAARVRLACAHNGFDLNVIQMEVEGENNRPTGRFMRND